MKRNYLSALLAMVVLILTNCIIVGNTLATPFNSGVPESKTVETYSVANGQDMFQSIFQGNFKAVEGTNVISLSSAEGEANSVVEMSVLLTNEDPVAGFQLDVPLNDQLTYVDGSVQLGERTMGNFNIAAAMVGSSLRILAYSMPTAAMEGNEGAICSFQLQLGEEAGTYDLLPEGVILSSLEGTAVEVSQILGGQVTINSGATANNIITVGNVSGNAGEVVELAISMDNVDPAVGFQFDINFPPQVTYVDGSFALTDRATSSHMFGVNMIAEGVLRVLVYSFPGTPFIGNTGDICTLEMTLGTEEGTYPLTLTNYLISDDMGVILPLSVVNGSVTINGETPINYTITATANPAEGGTIAGAGEYEEGATATLTATANDGYNFVNWTENGAEVSADAVYSFVVTADRNLVANFANVMPSNNVITVGNVSGNAGEVVELAISMDNVDPAVGFQFDINFPPQVTYVDGSFALTDRATANHQYGVNMIAEGVLRVLVYSFPGTPFIGNTGDICTLEMTLGTEEGTYPLTLTNYLISDDMGVILPLSVVNGSVTINGETPINYTITATANPADGGTIAGAGEYEEGATATLTATANNGYNFVNWTENGAEVSTDATYSFVVNADRNLVANFAVFMPTENVITVGKVSGNPGEVVELAISMDNVDPAVGFQFDINFPSQVTYVEGSFALTDRATANHQYGINMIAEGVLRVLVYSFPGTPFIGNTGDICTLEMTLGTEAGTYPLTLTNYLISDDMGVILPLSVVDGSVTINGEPTDTYTITAMPNPADGGTITGAGEYEAGATATLTATANNGFNFVNWTENGVEVSANATYSFVVNADRNLVANFAAVMPTSNVMTISSVAGEAGSTVEVAISLDNEDAVSGFQLSIPLNPELTYVEGSAQLGERASDNHIISAAVVNGTLNILAYSMPSSNFEGNSGDVCTFELQLGNTIGTYPLELTNVVLADVNGQEVVLDNIVNGQATIIPNVEGNTLSISNGFGVQGETIELSLLLDNSDPAVGVQVDIVLPESVTFVDGSIELSDRTTDNHDFGYNLLEGNVLRILVYSFPGTPFIGTSGAVLTFDVTLNGPDGYYPVGLTNYLIVDEMGASFPLVAVDGSVTIGNIDTYTVVATANPVEAGTITGAGVYASGSVVTLHAAAVSGWAFENWTEDGVVVSTNAIYTFTIESDRNLVANFVEANEYTITTTANIPAAGTLSGAGVYMYGDQAVVVANPAAGYRFVNWTENGIVVSSHSTYSFYVVRDRDLVANFELIPYTVFLTADPVIGGTVTGAGVYYYNDQVTISATTTEGYNFVKWTEDGQTVSTNATYTFSIDASHHFVANFEIKAYQVTAEIVHGNGTIMGEGEYTHGTTAVLDAIPAEGWKFESWSENGQVISTESNLSFVVTGNRNFEVRFAPYQGIEDVKESDITVYPNPTDSWCKVECPVNMTKVTVINSNGQIVRVYNNVDNTVLNIDMNGLEGGNYFVEIYAPKGNIVKKIVKL